MWWVIDPDRLKQEVAAIAALLEQHPWLARATPRLRKGLGFSYDFDISVNGETFSFALDYPGHFPDTPPVVTPRDGRRLSDHQYGDGGELCLEFRSDNWDPSVTGAMMIESAHRLLAGERPPLGEQAIVPSAHVSSLGQQLRGSVCRFLLTAGFRDYAAGLPSCSSRDIQVSEAAAPKRIWTAHVTAAGAAEWRETEIPERGGREEAGILLRIDDLSTLPYVPPQAAIDALIEAAGASPAELNERATGYSVVVADRATARMFFTFPKDGGRIVMPYDLVDFFADHGGRLPESYAALRTKKVGLVGGGALGAKIAVTLARSGVGEFVLIDDDVFGLGNLVRHELDALSLGVHKVDGLEARLKAIAPGITVQVRRIALGGQEAAGSTASALEALSGCDLLIDATADPQGFNFVAAAARKALKPMVWAEVYAGGIGGFVARLRPQTEPPPHLARRQYQAWCHEQKVPWEGLDRDYGTRNGGPSVVADDADVSVIAAHASRMALDVLARPEATRFPHPAYIIGLADGWIFGEPFDTRPMDFVSEGEWRLPVSTERAEEAIELMTSLFEPGEDADQTGT